MKFKKYLAITLIICATIFAFSACSKEDSVSTTPVKLSEKSESECIESEYISNTELWKTPGMSEKQPFQFEMEFTLQPPYDIYFDEEALKKSITDLNLGDYDTLIPKQSAREWGYSLTHLDGVTDGAGNNIVTHYSGKEAPKTRQEAVEKIKNFIFSQYIHNPEEKWLSMNGHYPWHHYACELGADMISSEIGENINNYQWHIALTRGAARQYQIPWGIDFSDWHGPSIMDNTIKSPDDADIGIWKGNSCPYPQGGHSLNLMERAMLMSYMSGADSIVAEAGALLGFYPELQENGYYKISPYGEVCQKVNTFTKNHSDVGTAYTPIALVLDYYHGAYNGAEKKKGAFFNFKYNKGDKMTWNIVDSIWNGGWEIGNDETGTMVNDTYGDYFDVLLQNASSEVLQSYPALLLSGDIKFSDEEVNTYKEYVKNGGTLILNKAYLKYFPEFKQSGSRYDLSFGEGTVMVYGPNFSTKKLDEIIKTVLNQTVPFETSKNVESLLSIKDGAMYLTLINNSGVTKHFREEAVITDEIIKADVAYKGNLKIKDCKDIYNNHEVTINNNNISVDLSSGDIAVLEFTF